MPKKNKTHFSQTLIAYVKKITFRYNFWRSGMFDNTCKKPDSIVSIFMKLCLLVNIINIILSIFFVITHNTNTQM